MFGQFSTVALGFRPLALPLGLRPDLDAIGQSDDHHVAFELRVVAQELRNDHPSQLVGLSRHGA